ncbi:MAG: TonB family protein [Rudaea sp.]|nr:TonB family protein [Rudaea sp.]
MAFSQTFIAGVDALGAVLLHFLWQGAALGLIYLLLRPLCPSVGARYRLGMGMLMALALCPLLTTFYVWPASDADMALASRILPQVLTGSIAAVAADAQSTLNLREFLPWLVAGWIVGVVAIALRSLWHWRRLARLVRYAAIPLPQWEAKLTQLCRRFGLLRPVRLLASARIATPMLIGLIKPVILLPLSMLSGFSAHQIELILAHELGHVRRWDYLANLVQVVIETVLFYHPVVHWISRDVRNARESCCDDLVLDLAKGNPITYARALADLEELRHDLDVVAPALGASGGILLARIRRIVGAEAQDPLPRNNAWPVLLVAAAVACLAVRPQHAVPDLTATLANAPVQSLALISGNPQLAGSAIKPALVVAVPPRATADPKATPVAAVIAAAEETGATVPVKIERLHIDKVLIAGNAVVHDIASNRALPVAADLSAAIDPVPAVAAAELPTRLHVVPPVYPPRAMAARVEGNVELEYSIAADGTVRDMQVLHAQPKGVFDAAAQAALSQWRFVQSAPAATNLRYRQNFAFTLTPGSASKQRCQQVIGSLICRYLEE